MASYDLRQASKHPKVTIIVLAFLYDVGRPTCFIQAQLDSIFLCLSLISSSYGVSASRVFSKLSFKSAVLLNLESCSIRIESLNIAVSQGSTRYIHHHAQHYNYLQSNAINILQQHR